MRIAILSPFYPYRGGIAQFSDRLYEALVDNGNKVSAFNFSRLYPDVLFPGKTQYVDNVNPVLAERTSRTLDSINPFSYQSTLNSIRKFNPDVLIISYWMSFFVPAYAHIANYIRKNCKVVALVHNAIPHEPKFFDKPLASLFFKRCDGFVCLSGNVEKDIETLCGRKIKCLVRNHPLYNQFGNPVDKTEARLKLNIDIDKKTLLFFGLIRDYKGLDLLIEAFTMLDDSYQLVIAGECYGSFDKYRSMIESSGCSERIHVMERYISDDEIPVLFSAADALMLPYRSATQSGVVSLAYNYELPMVSTPVGDFAETIEKKSSGMVSKEITPLAIKEKIELLFSSDNLSQFKKNIQIEKDDLTWDKFAHALSEYVKEIL
jgi:glycosyltransferase involved in cell wall biosynthesis